MKEIKIQELENIKIGSAENKDAATGCTVILCEQGMAAGLDVRGGGPASRESELLKPTAAAESIHAVLLSGGSAFGLDAAGGYGTSGGVDDLAVLRHLAHLADLYDLSVVDQDIAGLFIHSGHGD